MIHYEDNRPHFKSEYNVQFSSNEKYEFKL